jgi:hypothetical protein
MTNDKIRLYKRALELKEGGHEWTEIPELLAAEGLKTSKGNPYSWSTLKGECSRHRKEIEKAEASGKDQRVQHSDHDSTSVKKTPSQSTVMRTKELKTLIREVSREVFGEMTRTNVKDHIEPSTTLKLPPQPKRITTDTKRDGKTRGKGGQRQESRKFERMTITIDKLLLPYVKAAMRELRLPSVSKTLEVLAWNALGRPRLSYQDDPPDEEPGNE